eukprot:14866138-Alexandrium_andersonii.AAC.1
MRRVCLEFVARALAGHRAVVEDAIEGVLPGGGTINRPAPRAMLSPFGAAPRRCGRAMQLPPWVPCCCLEWCVCVSVFSRA